MELKNLKTVIISGILLISLTSARTLNPEQKGTKVLIHTTKGDIVVELYDETPQTRDNFIKLVNQKFYDSTLFHRVIKGFMIQGGDPQSKKAAQTLQRLYSTGPKKQRRVQCWATEM